MSVTQRKLAESEGVAKTTIVKAKETLGITDRTLSDEQAEAIAKEVKKTSDLQKEVKAKSERKSMGFRANVRRIDKQDDSSIRDMLQDCKEQYVKNEELIQRLQYEISLQDILMHGNSNGTLSPLPQLGILEKFQKVNISLRNQIVSLELELDRVPINNESENPFD